MSITLIIILITVVLSIYAWNSPLVFDKWLFNSYQIFHKKEYWRIVTSGFIHSDWQHLLFNMFSLFFFGRNVEAYYRYIFEDMAQGFHALVYIGLYLTGIILSDIYSLVKYKDYKHYNSLGASGAVSAVVYASILLSPLDKIYVFFIPMGIPGFIYGVLYLIYCTYQSKLNRDNINHNAHFYGALVGVVFTIGVFPASISLFIEQISQWRIF